MAEPAVNGTEKKNPLFGSRECVIGNKNTGTFVIFTFSRASNFSSLLQHPKSLIYGCKPFSLLDLSLESEAA